VKTSVAQQLRQLEGVHRNALRLIACCTKLWVMGFQVSLGAVHEAFTIHSGSFRGCRLHSKIC
jgi:hypothetical protein